MKRILAALIIIGLVFSLPPTQSVNASRGVPGSAEFGYGARLHLNGDAFEESLTALSDLHLDWVVIDLDWAGFLPEMHSVPETDRLDCAVQASSNAGTAVLLSLTNPPSWAMTNGGPDAGMTAQFLNWLLARYSGAVQAIELFPGANTFAGWKSSPNPADYARLFTSVQNQVTGVVLVAGGLETGSTIQPATDWSDLDFLRGLYANGAREWMSVLSLQFSALTGNPLDTPTETNINSLRRYELIRQVMLEYNHQNALIWITLLNAPDGKINNGDEVFLDANKQAEWLAQALTQLRSQLYMGVAFIHNLNLPASGDTQYNSQSMIQEGPSYHPFYTAFKAIQNQTNPSAGANRPGRPKGTILLKCQSKT